MAAPPSSDPARNRGIRILNGFMWLVLAIFTVLAIGSPLVGRGVFLATEIMGDYSPWQAYLEDGQAAENRYVGDTIDSMAPLSIRTVEDAWDGDLPEWSPYGMGGFELAGLPNSGLYSPLSLPWWILPNYYAPAVVKLLEIIAITIGMSLFLRRLGLPQATWPLASVVYAASGFMVAYTNWPQTRVAALIPLLFWSVERAVATARPWAAVPIGLVLAAMILGGFPAVTIYAGYAAGAWGLLRAIQIHRGSLAVLSRSLAFCATGVVLGLLLAAWQLIPFASNAMSVLSLESRNYRGVHLPTQYLASMVYPEIAGGIKVGTLTTIPVSGLSFVGIVALILISILPLGRAIYPGQSGVVLGLSGAVLFLIAAIYFGGPALELLQQLPTIATSHVARVRVIVGFFVAVLAAYGLGLLMAGPAAFPLLRRGSMPWPIRLLRIAAFVAINSAAAAVCLWAWELVPENRRYLLVTEVLATTAVGAVALLAAVVAAVARGGTAGRVAIGVVGLGLVMPALVLVRLWWPPSSEGTFYADTATHRFLAERIGDQRYASMGLAMLPGTNQVYALRSLGGRGFATQEWSALLRSIDPDYFLTPTFARLSMAAAGDAGRSNTMDRFGVRYLVQSGSDRPIGPSGAEPGAASGITRVPDGGALVSGPGRGPVRGFTFRVPVDSPVRQLAMTAEVIGADGTVLAATSSWQREAGGDVHIALAGEDVPAEQSWQLRLTLSSAEAAVPVQTTADGGLWAAPVVPADDRLRVVSTGDATVYERLDALQRVRWSGRAIVETDEQRRLALLNSEALPADTVVLEREQDLRDTEEGASATVAAAPTGDDDTLAFRVTSAGAGWLLVEDSLRRPGWTAEVDGSSAAIIPADHAAGAVFVPEGEHVVALRYRTPGLAGGSAVSAAALVGLAVLGAGAALRARGRSRR